MTKQELIIGHLLILWIVFAALLGILAVQARRITWTHVALFAGLVFLSRALWYFILSPAI